MGVVIILKNGKPAIFSETKSQQLKLRALRAAVITGERSGDAGLLDMEAVKKKAKQKAGLNSGSTQNS